MLFVAVDIDIQQLSTYDILEEIENYQLSWLSPKYLLKLVQ